MFLVDKYYNDSKYITYHKKIIDKIINRFDNHNNTYNSSIFNIPNNELRQALSNINNKNWQYSNFMHLIMYGNIGCGKEQLVNQLLERIFGKHSIELKEVEYTVSGYSNTKTKIMIKQSKHHIIIEPNTNGFDKYLIQDIIQDYAKSELLNIIKNRKLLKIVVINKIDNLSYIAQASLRQTMEKYSNICKFILISDQLSKIIEPIRSRCLLIRIPLPTKEQILETILCISFKEKINVPLIKLKNIINNSDNKITHALWLLEIHKHNINYTKSWDEIINLIIININNFKIINNKKLLILLKNIREQFYILFITNIPTQLIIRNIMIKLLRINNDLQLKYNIINITSIHEELLSRGTRQIIHFESYIIRLLYLFNNYNIK